MTTGADYSFEVISIETYAPQFIGHNKLFLGSVGCCQQTFENKKFVDITQQCFALLPQVNFPANNLNFH